MRVGATTGNLVGLGSAAAGCVVAFLMWLGLLPVSSGIVLLITSGVVCFLAFGGAYWGHYHPERPSAGGVSLEPVETPTSQGRNIYTAIDRHDQTAEERYWYGRQAMDLMREDARKIGQPLRQWPIGPIVEPEALSDAESIRVFLANIGDDAAVDVQIAPIGGDAVSFSMVRILRASDPKAEVRVFIDPRIARGGLSHSSIAWALARWKNKMGHTYALARGENWEGKLLEFSKTKLPTYVPLCLTYDYSHKRSYHTHEFVLAEDSNHQIVIRRKSDSEAVFGASPAHA